MAEGGIFDNLPDLSTDDFTQKLQDSQQSIFTWREESGVSRKKLGEFMRCHRESSPQDRAKNLGPMMRSFQEEVEMLTRRARSAEDAFLSLSNGLMSCSISFSSKPTQPISKPEDSTLDQDLLDKIPELEAEKADLQEEVDHLRSEIEELRQDGDQREVEAQRRYLVAEEELKKVDEEKKELQRSLRQVRAVVDQLRSEKEKEREKDKEKDHEIEELSNKLLSAEMDLNVLREELKYARDLLDQSQPAQSQEAVKLQQHEREELIEQIRCLQLELDELKKKTLTHPHTYSQTVTLSSVEHPPVQAPATRNDSAEDVQEEDLLPKSTTPTSTVEYEPLDSQDSLLQLEEDPLNQQELQDRQPSLEDGWDDSSSVLDLEDEQPKNYQQQQQQQHEHEHEHEQQEENVLPIKEVEEIQENNENGHQLHHQPDLQETTDQLPLPSRNDPSTEDLPSELEYQSPSSPIPVPKLESKVVTVPESHTSDDVSLFQPNSLPEPVLEPVSESLHEAEVEVGIESLSQSVTLQDEVQHVKEEEDTQLEHVHSTLSDPDTENNKDHSLLQPDRQEINGKDSFRLEVSESHPSVTSETEPHVQHKDEVNGKLDDDNEEGMKDFDVEERHEQELSRQNAEDGWANGALDDIPTHEIDTECHPSSPHTDGQGDAEDSHEESSQLSNEVESSLISDPISHFTIVEEQPPTNSETEQHSISVAAITSQTDLLQEEHQQQEEDENQNEKDSNTNINASRSTNNFNFDSILEEALSLVVGDQPPSQEEEAIAQTLHEDIDDVPDPIVESYLPFLPPQSPFVASSPILLQRYTQHSHHHVKTVDEDDDLLKELAARRDTLLKELSSLEENRGSIEAQITDLSFRKEELLQEIYLLEVDLLRLEAQRAEKEVLSIPVPIPVSVPVLSVQQNDGGLRVELTRVEKELQEALRDKRKLVMEWSGKLSVFEEEILLLESQNRDLRDEIELLQASPPRISHDSLGRIDSVGEESSVPNDAVLINRQAAKLQRIRQILDE